MKRRNLLYASSEDNADINVSPLIDIVFILLIFFIVTTVFVKETGVEVERPQASSSVDLTRDAIYLAVTADGSVMYDNVNIGVQGVRGVVQRVIREQADTPVIIQADRAAPIDNYVRVHDAAVAGGASVIQLATRRTSP